MNDLYSLWLDIKRSGLRNLCGRCEPSHDYTKIFASYRDNGFNEQFIFIERNRNTGYRISADKKPVIVRTKKAAFDYLQKFLLDAVERSAKYAVITVAEYAQLVGQIRHKQYVELGQRLDDLKRYNAYTDKQIKKGSTNNPV